MIVLYWIVLPKEKLHKCQIWMIWVSQGRLTDFGPKSSCGLVPVTTMMTSHLRHMMTRYSLSRIVTDVWPNRSVGSRFLFAARSVCKYKVCVQNKWNHVTCVIMRSLEITTPTHHSLSRQSLDFCSWTQSPGFYTHKLIWVTHTHTHTQTHMTHTNSLCEQKVFQCKRRVSWTRSPWLVGDSLEVAEFSLFDHKATSRRWRVHNCPIKWRLSIAVRQPLPSES